MRKLPPFLYAFALIFLVPHYIGTLARWVAYGFTGDPRGDLMFWTAIAVWVAAFFISKFWPAKPEVAE